MRRSLTWMTAFAATITLMMPFSIFLWFGKSTTAYAHNFVAFSFPISSPAPSSTSTPHLVPSPTPSHGAIDWSDPALLGFFTFLLLIFTVLLGVLAFTGPIPELIRKHKERKDQTEKKRNAIKLAKTYRKFLLADSHLINMQILDRKQSLSNSYVPLLLHQEVKLSYQLDAELLAAEVRRDPNESLRIGQKRKRFESLASTSLTPVEVIQNCKRCVILGDPGVGKTTLLKCLAIKSVRKELDGLPDLPIYIELNAFASSGNEDLLDFAATRWQERYDIPKAEARNCMEENLIAGNALLLLDALNETRIGETIEAAESAYQRVAIAILQIAKDDRYHQSPIVVTVRKVDHIEHNRLKQWVTFNTLELLDLPPEDIERFVNNCFVGSSNQEKHTHATDLNIGLKQDIHLQALAFNLLFLSLIVTVYDAQQKLSDNRTELYNQYVDILLNKWHASPTAHRLQEFTIEHKRLLLKEIAWHFHTKGQSYFPEHELLTVIADFLPIVGLSNLQSMRILEGLVAEYGLLKKEGSQGYSFLHLTIQEYFVALHAANKNELDTLLAYWDDPWWKDVILFYVGHSRDISPLLQLLLQRASASNDIFHTDVLLAGRWLAARHIIQAATLRNEVISRLFDILTKTPYSLTRKQIVEFLVKIGGPEVNERLAELLPNPLNLQWPFSAPSDRQLNLNLSFAIIQALDKHSDPFIIRRILYLLANPELERHLGQAIAFDMRWYITDALVKLGDPFVTSSLLDMLSNENVGPTVQYIILHFLGEHGDPSVAPGLLSLLSNKKPSPNIRQVAVALGKLGEPSVASGLLQLVANSETDTDVSVSIAGALGKMDVRSVAPAMLDLLSKEEIDLAVRQRIVYALGDLGEPKVAPGLLDLLTNPQIDSSLYWGIVYVLGELGERSVVPVLLPLLNNTTFDVVIHDRIIITLGKLGEHSMASKLLQWLSEPHVDLATRANVVEALGELGESFVAPSLLRLLPDLLIDKEEAGINKVEDLSRLGESLVHALGKLSGRSVAHDLLFLLSNKQIIRGVRKRIADTLGDLGEPSIASELLQILNYLAYDDNYVGGGVADALGKLGEKSVIAGLLQLLTNPDRRIDPDLRVHIGETLGKLGDESIVRALLPLLSDKGINLNGRSTIANIVGQLAKDETTVRKLAELLLTSDIADDIHQALWNVSNRIRVRVLLEDTPVGKEPEIRKLEDVPEP